MFFPIYVYTFQQGIFLRFTLQTSSGIIQFGKAVHSLGRRQLKSGRMELYMFCKYCGTELTPGAKFCQVCGKPVQNTSGSSQHSQTQAASGDRQGRYGQQGSAQQAQYVYQQHAARQAQRTSQQSQYTSQQYASRQAQRTSQQEQYASQQSQRYAAQGRGGAYPQAPYRPSQNTADRPSQKPKKKKSKTGLVIFIVILLVLLAAAGIVFALSSGGGSDDSGHLSSGKSDRERDNRDEDDWDESDEDDDYDDDDDESYLDDEDDGYDDDEDDETDPNDEDDESSDNDKDDNDDNIRKPDKVTDPEKRYPAPSSDYDIAAEQEDVLALVDEIQNQLSSLDSISNYPDYLLNQDVPSDSSVKCYVDDDGNLLKTEFNKGDYKYQILHYTPDEAGCDWADIMLEDTAAFILVTGKSSDETAYRFYFKDGRIFLYTKSGDPRNYDFDKGVTVPEFIEWADSETEDGDMLEDIMEASFPDLDL